MSLYFSAQRVYARLLRIPPIGAILRWLVAILKSLRILRHSPEQPDEGSMVITSIEALRTRMDYLEDKVLDLERENALLQEHVRQSEMLTGVAIETLLPAQQKQV